MKLLVIRHGIAEEIGNPSHGGKTDARRHLTSKGRKRMRRAAKALVRLVPRIDVLATSPLARAVETGEIVAADRKGLSPVQIAPLSPRKTPQSLLQWLQQQPKDATVAIVGHEPNLGIFVSWMMTGLQEPFVVFKKGGACFLQIDGEIRAGRAKLDWMLKSSQLRDL